MLWKDGLSVLFYLFGKIKHNNFKYLIKNMFLIQEYITERNCIMNHNKGFTLVELISAMAVAAVAGLALTMFLVTSYANYNTNMGEASLQRQAQMVGNILEKYISNANKNIRYEYELNGVSTEIKNDSEIPELYTCKIITVESEEEIYKIIWNKEEKKLYCIYDNFVSSITETLAYGVISFYANLDSLPENRVEYGFEIEDKKNELNYTITKSVHIRNKF